MKEDVNLSALKTIIRLMQKKDAGRFMEKLRSRQKPKKSVEEIVSETVEPKGKQSKNGDGS